MMSKQNPFFAEAIASYIPSPPGSMTCCQITFPVARRYSQFSFSSLHCTAYPAAKLSEALRFSRKPIVPAVPDRACNLWHKKNRCRNNANPAFVPQRLSCLSAVVRNRRAPNCPFGSLKQPFYFIPKHSPHRNPEQSGMLLPVSGCQGRYQPLRYRSSHQLLQMQGTHCRIRMYQLPLP